MELFFTVLPPISMERLDRKDTTINNTFECYSKQILMEFSGFEHYTSSFSFSQSCTKFETRYNHFYIKAPGSDTLDEIRLFFPSKVDFDMCV